MTGHKKERRTNFGFFGPPGKKKIFSVLIIVMITVVSLQIKLLCWHKLRLRQKMRRGMIKTCLVVVGERKRENENKGKKEKR